MNIVHHISVYLSWLKKKTFIFSSTHRVVFFNTVHIISAYTAGSEEEEKEGQDRERERVWERARARERGRDRRVPWRNIDIWNSLCTRSKPPFFPLTKSTQVQLWFLLILHKFSDDRIYPISSRSHTIH